MRGLYHALHQLIAERVLSGSILPICHGLVRGSAAFGLAVLVILVWIVSGPIFSFSDTWQLVINTGTTIVTFLMVFLIQRSQNKDSQAIHLKLNELVAATKGASNRLINVENLTEEEIKADSTRTTQKLVELAKADSKLTQSHSVEEASGRHDRKKEIGAERPEGWQGVSRCNRK